MLLGHRVNQQSTIPLFDIVNCMYWFFIFYFVHFDNFIPMYKTFNSYSIIISKTIIEYNSVACRRVVFRNNDKIYEFVFPPVLIYKVAINYH